VKQNTEAVLRAALAAARAAESAFGNAQVTKKTLNAALTAADVAGKTFIVNARKRLSKFLGEVYSTEWGAAGWPNNSTALPSTQAERFSLINSLKLYFTANPTQASVDMEVTAALAATLHTTMSNARAALDQKVTESGQAKATRDAAAAQAQRAIDAALQLPENAYRSAMLVLASQLLNRRT
jgi:hypothetical protein